MKCLFISDEKLIFMKFMILLFVLYSRTGFAQTETFLTDEIPVCGPEATFPGGNQTLFKYINDNLRYPERALKDSLQGKCYVHFVVETNGKVGDVKVTRNVPGCPECDEEAIRVIRSLPKWIPAKIDGKAIKSHFDLPISFILND